MKKKFWEAWGDTEALNAKLSILSFCLLVLVIILILVMAKTALLPKPVYYISAQSTGGLAYPGEVPDEVLEIFATNFVSSLINYTPATIEKTRVLTQKYLSPRLLKKVTLGLDEEIKRVHAHNISSLLSIDTPPEIIRKTGSFIVKIRGEKRVYLGQESVTVQRTVFTLYIEKYHPTEVNPCGLIITDLKQEEIKEKEE